MPDYPIPRRYSAGAIPIPYDRMPVEWAQETYTPPGPLPATAWDKQPTPDAIKGYQQAYQQQNQMGQVPQAIQHRDPIKGYQQRKQMEQVRQAIQHREILSEKMAEEALKYDEGSTAREFYTHRAKMASKDAEDLTNRVEAWQLDQQQTLTPTAQKNLNKLNNARNNFGTLDPEQKREAEQKFAEQTRTTIENGAQPTPPQQPEAQPDPTSDPSFLGSLMSLFEKVYERSTEGGATLSEATEDGQRAVEAAKSVMRPEANKYRTEAMQAINTEFPLANLQSSQAALQQTGGQSASREEEARAAAADSVYELQTIDEYISKATDPEIKQALQSLRDAFVKNDHAAGRANLRFLESKNIDVHGLFTRASGQRASDEVLPAARRIYPTMQHGIPQ
jgi:hypothetical protein